MMMRKMEVSGIRTTSRLLCVLCAAGLLACGASKSEIRRAQTSGYAIDFAIVYNQALKAVTKLYPQLIENASAGVISTAWHQVRMAQQAEDDQLSQQERDYLLRMQTSGAPSAGGIPYVLSGGGLRRKYYFVRFDVHVVGGNPWKVRVRAQASEWEVGAIPTEMKGGNEPHWLRGRVESLQVEIYRRLKKYAVRLEQPEESKDKPRELDTSRFAGLPEGAAKRVATVYRAATERDYETLRKSMAREFRWSLGGGLDADQAVAMWQADSSVLPRLVEILEDGCHAESNNRVTCPRAYSQQPGYLGYRAGFERMGGEWRLVFFLRGD
jgi:hypothetical protein